MAHGTARVQHPRPHAHACYHPHPTLGTSHVAAGGVGAPYCLPCTDCISHGHAWGLHTRVAERRGHTWVLGGSLWSLHAGTRRVHASELHCGTRRARSCHVCTPPRYIRVHALLCSEYCRALQGQEGSVHGGGGLWVSGYGGAAAISSCVLGRKWPRALGAARLGPAACARSPYRGLQGRQDAP